MRHCRGLFRCGCVRCWEPKPEQCVSPIHPARSVQWTVLSFWLYLCESRAATERVESWNSSSRRRRTEIKMIVRVGSLPPSLATALEPRRRSANKRARQASTNSVSKARVWHPVTGAVAEAAASNCGHQSAAGGSERTGAAAETNESPRRRHPLSLLSKAAATYAKRGYGG